MISGASIDRRVRILLTTFYHMHHYTMQLLGRWSRVHINYSLPQNFEYPTDTYFALFNTIIIIKINNYVLVCAIMTQYIWLLYGCYVHSLLSSHIQVPTGENCTGTVRSSTRQLPSLDPAPAARLIMVDGSAPGSTNCQQGSIEG